MNSDNKEEKKERSIKLEKRYARETIGELLGFYGAEKIDF